MEQVTGGPVHWLEKVSVRGSGSGRFEELSHGVLGASCVVPVGLREVVESPLDAHDGDGEVGQAGEVARKVTGAHPAPVFVVGDVAHVMESILDAPVSSHEFRDGLGGGLVEGKRGQPMDGLVLEFAGFADPAFALDAKGDLPMGQRGDVGLSAEVDDPAASIFFASVSFFPGAVLGGAHLGALPVEALQVQEQAEPVALADPAVRCPEPVLQNFNQ